MPGFVVLMRIVEREYSIPTWFSCCGGPPSRRFAQSFPYNMNNFLAGFIEGAKETPRAYFAPIIVWRLFASTTRSVLTPEPSSL